MNDAAQLLVLNIERESSHLVLECALQTHPNVFLIIEVVEHKVQVF